MITKRSLIGSLVVLVGSLLASNVALAQLNIPTFELRVCPESCPTKQCLQDGRVKVTNLDPNFSYQVKLTFSVSNSLNCPSGAPCVCGFGNGTTIEVTPNGTQNVGCALPNCNGACDVGNECTNTTITGAEIVGYRRGTSGSWTSTSAEIACDPPLNPWRATGCNPNGANCGQKCVAGPCCTSGPGV